VAEGLLLVSSAFNHLPPVAEGLLWEASLAESLLVLLMFLGRTVSCHIGTEGESSNALGNITMVLYLYSFPNQTEYQRSAQELSLGPEIQQHVGVEREKS
jgi:hypothetical protein